MTFFFLAQALAHGHVQQMQAIGLHPAQVSAHDSFSKYARALTFRTFFFTRNSAADAGHFGAGTNAQKYSTYWLICSKFTTALTFENFGQVSAHEILGPSPTKRERERERERERKARRSASPGMQEEQTPAPFPKSLLYMTLFYVGKIYQSTDF